MQDIQVRLHGVKTNVFVRKIVRFVFQFRATYQLATKKVGKAERPQITSLWTMFSADERGFKFFALLILFREQNDW